MQQVSAAAGGATLTWRQRAARLPLLKRVGTHCIGEQLQVGAHVEGGGGSGRSSIQPALFASDCVWMDVCKWVGLVGAPGTKQGVWVAANRLWQLGSTPASPSRYLSAYLGHPGALPVHHHSLAQRWNDRAPVGPDTQVLMGEEREVSGLQLTRKGSSALLALRLPTR